MARQADMPVSRRSSTASETDGNAAAGQQQARTRREAVASERPQRATARVAGNPAASAEADVDAQWTPPPMSEEQYAGYLEWQRQQQVRAAGPMWQQQPGAEGVAWALPPSQTFYGQGAIFPSMAQQAIGDASAKDGAPRGTPTGGTFPMSLGAFKYESSVQWTNMPLFPGTSDRIDAWFVAFEGKMRSKRVPQGDWGQHFLDCPKIGELVRKDVQKTCEDPDYATIRQFCLQRYGPAYPVGYFRSVIYAVKGATREEVEMKLQDALVLHNRASEDAGMPDWAEKELLYPFVGAFPDEVSRRLKHHIEEALNRPNPLKYLAKRAPSKEDDQQQQTEVIEYVSAVPVTTPRSPPAVSDELVQRVIAGILQTQGGSQPQSRKRPGPCQYCGRPECIDKKTCRAANATCRLCGKVCHFATVCRSKRPNEFAPNPNGTPVPFNKRRPPFAGRQQQSSQGPRKVYNDTEKAPFG